MRILGSILLLSFLALSTSGCSVNPATGKQSFTGLMSSDQELAVGKNQHPKILAQFGGAYAYKDLDTYVNDLGQRLAKVSELPNLKWTFTILDDPIINAFALPGGYIYISRGLIALAENEAELAAVLGHEIGHVTARHSAQRHSQSVVTGIGATLLGIIVGGPAGDIANFAGQAYLAGYSRSHEMEADMLGMRYMARLGYDPKASATFFTKLAEHTELSAKMRGQKGQQSHYGIFASHPDTRSRIVESTRIAATYPKDLTMINRPVFLSQVSGIDYGPSIKQGIINGQRFIHPDLRFEFDAPRDFTIINKPQYVAATHKNGSAMIFQMSRNKYGSLSTVDYLTSVWAKKYTLKNVEALDINSMPAATGETRLQTKNGIRNVRFLAIKEGQEIFQFRFLTPPELTPQMALGFRETTYSFRRLGHQEAKSYRGQHIALHKVGRGDSLGSLARRMKIEKFQEDWLKVLNKETLKNGLQAGETVKLVTR